MTFYMRMRLKHGMFWKGNYPPVPWKQIGLLAAVGVLLTLASSLDYYIARSMAAEQAAEIYGAQAQVLKDCEKGAVGYYYPDGRLFECSKKL